MHPVEDLTCFFLGHFSRFCTFDGGDIHNLSLSGRSSEYRYCRQHKDFFHFFEFLAPGLPTDGKSRMRFQPKCQMVAQICLMHSFMGKQLKALLQMLHCANPASEFEGRSPKRFGP